MLILTPDEEMKYLYYNRNGEYYAMDFEVNGVKLRVWEDGLIGKYIENRNKEIRLIPLFPNKYNKIKLGRSGKLMEADRIVYFAFNFHRDITDQSIVVKKHFTSKLNYYSNLYV